MREIRISAVSVVLILLLTLIVKGQNEGSIHTPYKEQMCVACHEENTMKLLYKTDESELCYTCHDAYNKDKHVHGPVASGQCLSCHDPHESKNIKLLKMKPDELCLSCHEERKTKKNVVHGSQKLNNCTGCHSPHSSPYQYQLIAETPKLCSGCHGDIGKATYPHVPVQQGQCLDCHSPHNSDASGLIKNNGTRDLCFSCHADMKIKITSSKYVHNGSAETCTDCHKPHGSDNPNILKTYFSPFFYNKFDPKNYALCSECHDVTDAINKEETRATDFRNGQKNLHYVHVANKPEKSRNCKTCHDPHCSDQEKYIKKESPFGKSGSNAGYMIPIKFTKADKGGTCMTGCHKTRSYDRISPVRN